METNTRRWIRAIVLGTMMSAGVMVPTDASAWIYDDRCAMPATEDNLDAYVPPNALFMVDRSGSMSLDATDSLTRWEAAKAAIDELGKAMVRSGTCSSTDPSGCDKIRMGLGLFWDGWFSYSCDGDGDGDDDESCTGYGPYADVTDPVQEDNHTPIMDTLNSHLPGGGTPTGEATRALLYSESLQDTDSHNVGVLVTDGEPSSGEAVAISNLCQLKSRSTAPADSYVVGFSSGTNTDYNSLLAAAGGTGHCCPAGQAGCAVSERIDPCGLTDSEKYDYANYALDGDSRALDCAGAKQADNPTELKETFMDVVQEIACTFDLNFPSETYDTDTAYSDPTATDVQMYHKQYGWLNIPHDTSGQMDDMLLAAGATSTTASQYESEGWHFFDDTKRRRVQLSSKVCGDLLSGHVETIETQVACDCPNTGDYCTVDGNTGMCADGQVTCQISDTEPGVDACTPIHAPNSNLGVECTLSGNVGRCKSGVKHCVDGQETCKQAVNPMPEICNGLDDDCNGQTDDIGKSWDSKDWKTELNLADEPDAACGGVDACLCQTGDPDTAHRGLQMSTLDGEFQSMVKNTQTGCWCME